MKAYLGNAAGADVLFTSALSRTELIRAVAGAGPAAIARARRLLAALDTVNLTWRLLEAAAVRPPLQLRSLDAIHLAAAQTAGSDLREVLAYDNRMKQATTALGMTPSSPGW